ncbi:MAG: purine-nucleoside phosphorylase [Anaerolineae bacterium]
MPTDTTDAVAVVRSSTDAVPRVAVVAGSGLSGLADGIEGPVVVPYVELPGWPASTVRGHTGQLVLGRLGGTEVAIAAGRAHLYEGYSPQEVTFGVRVMRDLGATVLIVTNAAGGLNPEYAAGDLMVIADHVFLPGLSGLNPLVGSNDSEIGPRFPSMTNAYDPALREYAARAARAEGLTVHEGVYAMVAGPSYETPAEARALRALGGDAVGMSTAPEVVVARHAGMRVLGLSLITNRVRLEPQSRAFEPEPDLHAEVIASSGKGSDRLSRVIAAVAASL